MVGTRPTAFPARRASATAWRTACTVLATVNGITNLPPGPGLLAKGGGSRYTQRGAGRGGSGPGGFAIRVPMLAYHHVCRVGGLGEGEGTNGVVGRKVVAVFRDRGRYFAI